VNINNIDDSKHFNKHATCNQEREHKTGDFYNYKTDYGDEIHTGLKME